MAAPVTLENLTKHFGSTIAVDQVNLTIPAGSLFFLLGPSGCGKTTLLRMLAGFIAPTRGAIFFGQRDVTHLEPEKRNTGMCFQSYALWPHMTVAENVAFGLTVRKIVGAERDRQVQEALELVQMGSYGKRKPNELSGGQQQRVALARALVVKPDLLLLDEPLSNLDAKLRLEMRSQIRRICKQADITALYVTHDQKEALALADVMAVLHDGRVVQQGPPREMYHRPRSRFVADFLGETNFFTGTLAAIAGPRALVRTAAGMLASTAWPAGAAVGAEVHCSIRPEAVRLLSAPEGTARAEANRFPAQRMESLYLGEMAQHQLRLADGTVMKAYELNPSGEISSAPCVLEVLPEDVVVLEKA